MRRVLGEMDLRDLGGLGRVARHESFAQDALAFVSLLKQNRVGPGEFALAAEAGGTPRLQALAHIYSHYQARLQAARLRDFRDLVADAISLLEARIVSGFRIFAPQQLINRSQIALIQTIRSIVVLIVKRHIRTHKKLERQHCIVLDWDSIHTQES